MSGRANRSSRPCPDPTVTAEAFGDELALYSERTEQVHCLSPSAALVWVLCDGRRDVEAIVEEVAAMIGPSAGGVRGDVEAAIEQFRHLGVLR